MFLMYFIPVHFHINEVCFFVFSFIFDSFYSRVTYRSFLTCSFNDMHDFRIFILSEVSDDN
jgi:hypothetical protein